MSDNKANMSSFKRMKFKGRIKTYWTAYCTSCSWSDRTITPTSAIFPTCSKKQHRWQSMLGESLSHRHPNFERQLGFLQFPALPFTATKHNTGNPSTFEGQAFSFLLKIKNSAPTFPAKSCNGLDKLCYFRKDFFFWQTMWDTVGQTTVWLINIFMRGFGVQ